MNILQDIHAYLIISFLLTCWFVFKIAYKKLDRSLTKEVDDIRNLLDTLKIQKQEAETRLIQLKRELEDAEAKIENTIAAAEEEAQRISEKSNQETSKLVRQKQAEYAQAIKKIEAGISVELQHKIADAIIEKLVSKLQESRDNREFQNLSIENSTAMIEKLVEKYIK